MLANLWILLSVWFWVTLAGYGLSAFSYTWLGYTLPCINEAAVVWPVPSLGIAVAMCWDLLRK